MEAPDEAVDHVRGGAGRPLVEYGDDECPYSRQASRQIELTEVRLTSRSQYLGGDVRPG